MVLVAFPLWGADGRYTVHTGTTLKNYFVFSAAMAAVDPITVLNVFEEIGVSKMLYFLVFGESLLNGEREHATM